MLAAATATLERLGLSEHQAVIVAHSDTEHPHIHVITNLVHPETGKVAAIRQDQRTLSAWALEYEQTQGKVYCREREENAAKREKGELTHYQQERVEDAPSLTQLYQQSDTGKAFVSALQEAGYTLAQGDRGRLVIVDDTGKVQNLVRQIDGAKKKDIEKKLADIDLASLPLAIEVMAGQKDAPAPEKPPDPVPLHSHLVGVVSVEATPTPPLVSYLATVAELSNDAPEGMAPDLHSERVDYHIQRYEAAIYQDMQEAQEAEVPEYATSPPMPPIKGLAQHVERAATHLHRVADWIRTKPREYWENWCNKRQERLYPSHHEEKQPPAKQRGFER